MLRRSERDCSAATELATESKETRQECIQELPQIILKNSGVISINLLKHSNSSSWY